MREVLDKENVPMYLATMGEMSKLKEFLAFSKFDQSRLLVDQKNSLHDQLGAERGAVRTFFYPSAQLAMSWQRFWNGHWRDLPSVMFNWRPTMPAKMEQTFVQGAVAVMIGRKVIWKRLSQTTMDHPDFGFVLAQVRAAKILAAQKK